MSRIGSSLTVMAVCCLVTALATVIDRAGSHPPGGNLTVPELIASQGYPVEVHQMTTPDGYILEMHRIPHGINDTPTTGKPVAFLNHCVTCCSSDWIMNTPDKAFAYMMADAGYDVWMSNFRGNTYSRGHVEYDPDIDFDYWKFTWDQMGTIDLAVMLDYTLQTTEQPDLYFVGFSMGTTTFFALLSDRPEYNEKIRVMTAMAPVAYLQHVKGPIAWLAPFSEDLDLIVSLFGKGELLPSRDITDQIVEEYCDIEAVAAKLCYNILFIFAGGPDPALLNKEFLPLILTQTPAGTSVHTINHYSQLVKDTDFRKYNWGKLGNQEHYGQNVPPVYNLTNIKVPVAIFSGANDWIATPEDVKKLSTKLPNVILNKQLDYPLFNHLDFVWAYNAHELVYLDVMDVLSQY